MNRATIGAVLAGGLSSRMGAPKAGLELAGRPLASHAVDAVAAAGLEPVVVAKPESELPELGCRVILEPDLAVHPAAGVLAALDDAGGPVVVVACDMPFVAPELLAHLAGIDRTAALPRVGGTPQPLLARYGRAALQTLAAAIRDSRPMQLAVAELDPLVLEEDELARFGDPERIVFNVNDRDDLARAERLVQAAAR